MAGIRPWCPDEDATRVLSLLKITIRTKYSNSPMRGTQVVAMVLNTPRAVCQWEEELA